MATRQTWLALTHADAASFRATAREPGDALRAFGWVQTADTGQIDWNTVARPGQGNTQAGYEIFRPADALWATAPFYLKVMPGSGATQNSFGWWFQLLSATNGAGAAVGNATVQLWTDLMPASGGSPDANGRHSFLSSGDTARFVMLSGYTAWGNASHRGLVNVERLKTATGADSNEGGYLYTAGGQTMTPRDAVLPLVGSVPTYNSGGVGCMMPTGNNSGMIGADVTIYPVRPFNRRELFPIRGLAAYFAAELPQVQAVVASIYGVAQTWFTGNITSGLSPARSGTNGYDVMIRWE